MTLLNVGGQRGRNTPVFYSRVPLIEEAQLTGVGSTDQQIWVLLGESHRAKRRSRLKAKLGCVGVVEIPNVGLLWHISRLLLEAELSIGDTNSILVDFGVPRNLGDRSFDRCGVLEDHKGLGGDGFAHELGVFAVKVLLKQVDDVVLLDAAFCAGDQVTSGLCVPQGWLLDHLAHVLVHIIHFGVVDLFGPATHHVLHSVVISRNALSVHLHREINSKER